MPADSESGVAATAPAARAPHNVTPAAGTAGDGEFRPIVTIGISEGRMLTRPIRDARRFPSTRWYRAPGTGLRVLRWGLRFVHRPRAIFCRAVPNLFVTIRNLLVAASHLAPHSPTRLIRLLTVAVVPGQTQPSRRALTPWRVGPHRSAAAAPSRVVPRRRPTRLPLYPSATAPPASSPCSSRRCPRLLRRASPARGR